MCVVEPDLVVAAVVLQHRLVVEHVVLVHKQNVFLLSRSLELFPSSHRVEEGVLEALSGGGAEEWVELQELFKEVDKLRVDMDE